MSDLLAPSRIAEIDRRMSEALSMIFRLANAEAESDRVELARWRRELDLLQGQRLEATRSRSAARLAQIRERRERLRRARV